MSATAQTNGRTRGPRVPLIPVGGSEPEPTPAVSRQSKQLDTAVMAVQAAAPQLSRNARGQIQSRTYGYVTLDAIVDAVLPLLVEQGLVWKAFPTVVDGAAALRYRMTHIKSGEFDEDVMPLLCDQTSQGLGSGITYARRYSLCAYLNLTVDPDDDGAIAMPTGREPVDRYAEAAETHAELDKKSTPKPTAQRKDGPRPSTVRQRNMLRAKAKAAKLTQDEFANLILVATGHDVRTYSGDDHAKQTVDRLLDHLAASAVNKVKDALVEREQAA